MKIKKVFTCQNCGFQSPKWLGKCADCNQWNSFVEETYNDKPAGVADAGRGFAALKEDVASSTESGKSVPLKISEIKGDETTRVRTSFAEFNRVLGGGIVQGSLVLIGGDPGIGKSTLLMQALASAGQSLLYVSGEESAYQIKLRAKRLGVNEDKILIYGENVFENIVEQVKKIKPQILVIDSIQTLFSNGITSAPGSVSQIRECTGKILMLAKTMGIATFIVGHITKEGSIAGPKVLEHMVDTVLYFENSTSHVYRLLRAVKNRFGSTNEIGVFEMREGGLHEVTNPSELFLQERSQNTTGSVVVSAIEGSRTVLVEIQALVSSSNLNMPRRTCLGVDNNKVSLLIAVIEKKLGIPLYGHDIFVNVAGGIELDEPAVDLGVALALISSFRNKPIDPGLLICGEIGLTGEVRHISHLDMRLAEAKKLGFKWALAPKSSLEKAFPGKAKDIVDGMRVISVKTLAEAVDRVFEEGIMDQHSVPTPKKALPKPNQVTELDHF